MSSRQTSVPTRAWDQYDAYLFDIDGTLINCTDAVHYFAFCEALHSLAGRPLNLDGVIAHGNTDVGILRDALTLAGIPETAWRANLSSARDLMCAFVEARTTDLCTTVLASVPDVLGHLAGRGAVLGVATGNLARIGRAKLESAGLLRHFHFGGYSDAFEYRRDVFSGALAQARALAGQNASVCVFGDTPEDIRAARANGLDVVAVATGIYTFEELAAESPDRCLHSFDDLFATTEDSKL